MKNDNTMLIAAAKKARLEQVNYWTTVGAEKENAKLKDELNTAATTSSSSSTATPAKTSTPNKNGIEICSNLVSSSSKSTNNPNKSSSSASNSTNTTPIKSKILNKSNSGSNLLSKNTPIVTSLKSAFKRKLSGGN